MTHTKVPRKGEFVVMWGYESGWMLLWMTLVMGGTILLIVWGVRQLTGSGRQGDSRALEILEERYARGDIDR
ncbi:MAG: hypothetical protein ACE1Z0_02590, partial [Acidimicrobiia bacterium]